MQQQKKNAVEKYCFNILSLLLDFPLPVYMCTIFTKKINQDFFAYMICVGRLDTQCFHMYDELHYLPRK